VLLRTSDPDRGRSSEIGDACAPPDERSREITCDRRRVCSSGRPGGRLWLGGTMGTTSRPRGYDRAEVHGSASAGRAHSPAHRRAAFHCQAPSVPADMSRSARPPPPLAPCWAAAAAAAVPIPCNPSRRASCWASRSDEPEQSYSCHTCGDGACPCMPRSRSWGYR